MSFSLAMAPQACPCLASVAGVKRAEHMHLQILRPGAELLLRASIACIEERVRHAQSDLRVEECVVSAFLSKSGVEYPCRIHVVVRISIGLAGEAWSLGGTCVAFSCCIRGSRLRNDKYFRDIPERLSRFARRAVETRPAAPENGIACGLATGPLADMPCFPPTWNMRATVAGWKRTIMHRPVRPVASRRPKRLYASPELRPADER